MKSLKLLLALLAAFLLFSLSGCASRVRLSAEQPNLQEDPPVTDEHIPAQSQPNPEEAEQSESQPPAQDPVTEPTAQPDTPALEEPTLQDVPTQENPDAESKEYSADAPAQFDPEGESPIVSQEPDIEAPSAPVDEPGAVETGNQESSDEEDEVQQITQVVPSDEAQQQAPDEDAPQADTQLSYFRTLLEDVRRDLFECEKFYIYWETEEDYTTVLKTDAQHQIISSAGGYNVSAKLTQDRLVVDDGWVSRKNPGVIVKCVDSSVLGCTVNSTAAAKAVRDSLVLRPEWSSLDAVAGQRVLILSQELLQTESGRCAAALYLAKIMYPQQLDGVDENEACCLLLEEAGESSGGIYAFAG